MHYIDKLKAMTDKKSLHIKEISDQVQIFSLLDENMINQENYFEMECKEKVFNIYRVSRGEKIKVANFCEEKYAYLFIGLLANESIESIINPMPEDTCDFFDANEDDLKALERIITKYINSSNFSIFGFKNNSICLIREERYIVYYIDSKGEKNVINDDNDKFGLGLQILCNYAWSFQRILEQTREWNVEWDNEELLYAMKKLLNVQEN